MSEAEPGGQLSPDDMADMLGGETADVAAEGGDAASGIMAMLRSSEPPVSPAEVGRELDLGAEWWEHLGAGFMKASGSGGTEAWMHFVMAVLLLAVEYAGDPEPDGDTPDSGTPETDDDVERYQGPQ